MKTEETRELDFAQSAPPLQRRAIASNKVRITRNRKALQRNLQTGSGPETDERDTDGVAARDERPTGAETKEDSGCDTDLDVEERIDSYDHSGRAAYVAACRSRRVVPVSYYLRHMQDSELAIRHHQLGSDGVQPIAASLTSNATVTSLDLSDNWLGFDGAVTICDMLKENCFITSLNLSDNHLGPESAEVLAAMIQVTNNITHVTLAGNGFDDRAAAAFAEAIMSTSKVEYLNLSHNKFGEIAGMLLGPAISENSSLKHLDLSWNSFRRRGAVAIAQGVKANVYMKRINLSWNGLGLDGAKELARALSENSVLEELDITNNRMTTEAAVCLGKGLVANETLCILKIGKNPMQSAGCWAVCNAVLKNQNSVLKELDFIDINVNKDFHDICNDLKAARPGITIRFGVVEPALKPRLQIHPMMKLQNFITKNNLKLIEFFQKFDKNKSMSISGEDFPDALRELGISLRPDEIELLIKELDKDGDGEIDYSELVLGADEIQAKENASIVRFKSSSA